MSAQSSRKRAVAELEDPIEDALIAKRLNSKCEPMYHINRVHAPPSRRSAAPSPLPPPAPTALNLLSSFFSCPVWPSRSNS